jgi:hypothetical protein
MRSFLCAILLAGAFSLFAQDSADPALARARQEVARLKGLVAAGAASRLQLQKAEGAVAEAEDEVVLRKTLYGDLTEEQSEEMLAAADRRVERRQKAFDDAKKLVDARAAGSLVLDSPRRELEKAQREKDLAVSRADLVHEISDFARVEADAASLRGSSGLMNTGIADRYDGSGAFTTADLADIIAAYERQFGKAMPVSAQGETATHRAMGFDHTGRVDVALQPDSQEGQWLRAFLMLKKVPFIVFRNAVRGKATGAHIHVGPVSGRLASGG